MTSRSATTSRRRPRAAAGPTTSPVAPHTNKRHDTHSTREQHGWNSARRARPPPARFRPRGTASRRLVASSSHGAATARARATHLHERDGRLVLLPARVILLALRLARLGLGLPHGARRRDAPAVAAGRLLLLRRLLVELVGELPRAARARREDERHEVVPRADQRALRDEEELARAPKHSVGGTRGAGRAARGARGEWRARRVCERQIRMQRGHGDGVAPRARARARQILGSVEAEPWCEPEMVGRAKAEPRFARPRTVVSGRWLSRTVPVTAASPPETVAKWMVASCAA